jgi:CSLREA domain-containing protein
MIRSHRSLAWSLILVLLCASFALAQKPPTVARAAGPFVVTKVADTNDGACNVDCSLREAITDANTAGGNATITFKQNPDDAAVWVISPLQSLPPLTTDGITIQGLLDFSGAPAVIIDGGGRTAAGLTINSSNNQVRQLVFINFRGASATTGAGILIVAPQGGTATNNKIIGCYIGVKPGDTTSSANQQAGIRIDSASGNFIGGPSFTDRNIIAGNDGAGIQLNFANNNTILNNYVGLIVSGPLPAALGNGTHGIELNNSSGNTVGGSALAVPPPGNYIGGNALNGLILTGANTKNNTIAGNFIGNDGTRDLGNGGNGVTIENFANNNTVSGNTLVPSMIGGNAGYGVLITDEGTSGNHVVGAYIGVTSNGANPLPNDLGGVSIADGANNNLIGASGQGNIISGNAGYGLTLKSVAPSITTVLSNTITGNFIGLNSAGTQPISNTLGGVLISSGTKNNRLGGSSTAEQNVISGNGGPGVVISGTATLSNTVTGNIIGLRASSVGGLFTTEGHNSGDGVLVANGAQYSRIGGTTAEANTIAANTGNGVHVAGNQTKLVTISENYIGVALSSEVFVPAGNTQNGVLVDGGAQQVSILKNHISGNTLKGIALVPNTPAPGGSSSNANHDIDPPFNIHVNQNGQLTGRVTTTGATDACVAPCTVQIFNADPATLDGEGRDFLSQQITSNGYFTATLSGLRAQYALTATDKHGNTSEFLATPPTTIGPIDLQEAAPNVQDAVPGQVVTYTHQLVNNGTVDLLDLKVKALSSRKWTVATVPISGTLFALAAGQTKLVTVTLKLPFSPDNRVLAGPPPDQTVVSVRSTQYVTVTDSVTDTTNVLPQFLLDATPLTRSGVGAPDSANSVVRYVHTLTNKGNVAGTVLISAVTDRTWVTTVSTDTVKLAPGEVKNVTISVTIPSGTAANSTPAKTTVTLNVPETPSQNKTLTDTTAVELTPSALLIHTGEADAEAGAGGTTSFLYKVENRSNGTATFSLSGLPSFGGTSVTFKRLDGQQFGPGNSFTLSNVEGSNELHFVLEVKLDSKLLVGDVETVTILLLDDQNRTRAAAQDRITIKKTAFAPRLYLPLVSR